VLAADGSSSTTASSVLVVNAGNPSIDPTSSRSSFTLTLLPFPLPMSSFVSFPRRDGDSKYEDVPTPRDSLGLCQNYSKLKLKSPNWK